MNLELLGRKADRLIVSTLSKMNEMMESIAQVKGDLMKNDDIFPTFENEIVDTVNFKEEDDKFLVEIPANGAKKENISINVKGDKLTVFIQGMNENEDGSKLSFASRVERTIPANVERSGIKAKVKNDILTVTLPKKMDKVDESKDTE